MALTRNTTNIAKQTTGNSATFVTGSSASPNKILKWDTAGNAVSSGIEISNESFGGANPSSSNKIPTQESVNALINSRLGTIDGSQLGEVKINPSNNPPFGSGGLSISAKVNGEQTITYTPPDVLTAEQIDNSGFDAGEFAIFNSDGNLVTSNLKKNLLINAASSDFTVPTSHTVYKYGQNISASRLLGVDNTISHGDFLSYNSATGGFETTAASISNHKLFSANHTDVATSINPSYGDSIYYDGNEWTTGNFGNFGADMEYKGITGQSGATYSELSYGNMNPQARQMYGRSSNGLDGAFPPTPQTAPEAATNLSGNFSGLRLTSISNDPGTQIYNDTSYTISGKAQFPINGFSGPGLVNSKIRGLYIRSQVFMHASSTGNDREAEMYVTYPDGSKQPLLRTDKEPYVEIGTTTNIEQTVFVPVNEGQTQVEIEFNLDKSTGEGFGFEIIGALCTKRIELSPEVDIIHIVGSQNSSQRNQGYIDASTNSFNNDTDIWTSETPGTSPATDWSGVLPITIPDNVDKTVIRVQNDWNYNTENNNNGTINPSGSATSGLGNEEIDHITITIDWNEQTIFGTYLWNAEVEGTGFLYANDLVGEKTFTISEYVAASGLFTTTIKFEVNGRTIVKLPCPDHNNEYDNKGQNYTIENYKTIASAARRLETGFTILATSQLATVASPISGTVDTDGYLMVTAKFTGSAQDDFTVDIAGTVFENNNDGNSQNAPFRETLTLPIAASETYSIASNEGTTFDVRFKAKSTELSDSNSFNLIDSGVTGSFSSDTTFQELDLSHVVGANKTLVVLEVFGGTDTGIDRPTNDQGHTIGDESADGVYFRQNNSSIIQSGMENPNFSVLDGGSAHTVIEPTGGGGVITVMTDVTGKVEQRSTFGGTVYYKVQAYQGVVSPSIPAGFQNASLTVNGYQVLPGGLIMQWGEYTDADIAHGEDFDVTFPIPFPNALLQLNGQPNDNAVDVTNNNMAAYQRFITSDTSGFTAEVGSDGGGNMNMTFQWNALGH